MQNTGVMNSDCLRQAGLEQISPLTSFGRDDNPTSDDVIPSVAEGSIPNKPAQQSFFFCILYSVFCILVKINIPFQSPGLHVF